MLNSTTSSISTPPSVNEREWFKKEIKNLLIQKNAILLAHYYQEPDIQELADYVGDSLGLSQKAAETKAAIIVFAGVHFMAETAKILNPSKKVLLPDLAASCSLAESCLAADFKVFKEQYPNHVVVSYINCSADIKALSDIICTSANAEQVINSIPKDKSILFIPDKNLGRYLIKKTGRYMVLWDGVCHVHQAFDKQKIEAIMSHSPDALFLAHPESDEPILQMATFVGSTSAMINYVKKSNAQRFIIATEAGILHQMQKEVPNKSLIPAPAFENNTCACSECNFMKMNTLEKLYNCLMNESPEITLDNELQQKALVPINRMLALSVL